jgi:outer membrane murein-binding lipoprotein Lpp
MLDNTHISFRTNVRKITSHWGYSMNANLTSRLNVLLACLLTGLAGCAVPIKRDCATIFYGEYQSYRDIKAMAIAMPTDMFTSKEYGRVLCQSAHMKHDMQSAVDTALSGCNRHKVEWFGSDAKDMNCLIYAKGNQIQPWVHEMNAAWDRNQRSNAEASRIFAAGMTDLAVATAPRNSGYTPPPTTTMPQYTPPPTTSISNPSASPQATVTSSGEHPLNSFVEIFSDKFDWCRGPSNACNIDHLIEIKDDKGVVGGQFGISIRPVSADMEKNSLDYTVHLINRSLCKLHLYSSTITHARKGPSTWDVGSVLLEPKESRKSKLKTFSFDKESNGRAVISVSGQLSDCNYPSG